MKLFCLQLLEGQARDLAVRSGFEFAGVVEGVKSLSGDYVLFLNEQGLNLCQTGKNSPGSILCEFTKGSARHRRLYGGGKSQVIAKAIGIKDRNRPYVADLTAGLGADAFVLASLGCNVAMVERNSVVAALLQDGLDRAQIASEEESMLAEILTRMAMYQAEAKHWLASLSAGELPDVIYLDPMFPERKKSALVNKKMQALQHVVSDDADANALLPLALESAKYRVVVKRPSKAPWLDNQKPGLSLGGKSVRFDIYPLKTMSMKKS